MAAGRAVKCLERPLTEEMAPRRIIGEWFEEIWICRMWNVEM